MSDKHNDYEYVCEYTLTTPLAHGAGTEGNEQILSTESVNLFVNGSWDRYQIPQVSAASFKAALREAAVEDFMESMGWLVQGQVQEDAFAAMAEQAGLRPDSFKKNLMRLLLKGGEVTGGSQSISLSTQAQLRECVPPVSLFGAMHGGMTVPGRVLIAGPVRPFCQELIEGNIMQRTVRRAPRLTIDGHVVAEQGPAEEIVLFDGAPPIPVGLCLEVMQNFKHDLTDTALGQRLLGAKAVAEIADQREAVQAAKAAKGKAKPKAEERRAANESMPYSTQVIPAGTPMLIRFKLQQATHLEQIAMLRACYRWARAGARLGGGAGSGKGGWGNVRFHGAWSMEYASGAVASDASLVADVASPAAKVLGLYDEHLRTNAARVKNILCDVLR